MNILEQLKTQTREAHDSIEAKLNLMDPGMTEDKYKEILKGFFGFYATAEKCLREFSELYPEKKEKLSSLKRDLEFFDIKTQSLSALPPEKLSLHSKEEALGLLYVIEGSTLGGQVLSQHFREKFHFQPDQGLDFFSGYGERTMKVWQETRAQILACFEQENLNPDKLIGQREWPSTFLKHG